MRKCLSEPRCTYLRSMLLELIKMRVVPESILSSTWRPRYLLLPSSNFPPLENGCARQTLVDEAQSTHLSSACILACILVRHKLSPVHPQYVLLKQSRIFSGGSPQQCQRLNCFLEQGFFAGDTSNKASLETNLRRRSELFS